VKNITTYVGVDAHKKDLFIAMLVGDQRTPVTWQLPNEANAVRRLVRKLERDAPGPVRMCYEAGSGGYVLQRQVTTPRVSCQVIAPALIPRKPGDRVKTNRRDARKLAELLRAGLLTEVRPPTPAEEAVRDLCRARDDAREDLQRCRHRLGKLLLRRGLHYGGRNWTRAHRRWVDSLKWAQPAERVVIDDYLLAIDQQEARLIELDVRLTEIAQSDPYREPVGWLRCFRGIDTLTAILILAELHDFRRFHTPRALMAYLGLVPGEDSTGEKHRRGRITRTGNALVRRLLVETAWHYQHRPGVGVALTRRRRDNQAGSLRLRTRRSSDCVAAFGASLNSTSPRRRLRSLSRASWPASSGRRSNRHPYRRRKDRMRDGEQAK
jgi:transposase